MWWKIFFILVNCEYLFLCLLLILVLISLAFSIIYI